MLVEIVEVGTQRQKEIVVVILLQVCEDSVAYRTMVAREGAIPPLVALSQSGTNRAKQKVLFSSTPFPLLFSARDVAPFPSNRFDPFFYL